MIAALQTTAKEEREFAHLAEATALKLGSREQRFLIYLWDRRRAGKPFPTTEEIDFETKRDFGTRGGPAMYRQMTDKGFVARAARGWETGYFTARGLMIVAALSNVRDQIPAKIKRAGPKSWTPEMGMRTVHEATRRSATAQEPMQRGYGVGKLGGKVLKGWLKGASIYYLTLEERATCPVSCQLLDKCYGDSMGWTVRFNADADLIPALDDQIRRWARTPQPRLVRLHELGDFYSEEYVTAWAKWVAENGWLNVFGFTAWGQETPIGAGIQARRRQFHRRWAIRFSSSTGPWSSTVVAPGKSLPSGSFWCPEQDRRVPNCGACGACWGTEKRVAFKEH